jgi:hypothetical protein
MNVIRLAALCCLICAAWHTEAQKTIEIVVPAMTIVADQLQAGDADLYGLGDWQCKASARFDGTDVVLEAHIVFSERSNDYSVLAGSAQKRVKLTQLEGCRHCEWILLPDRGTVSGPNVGARGYKWYVGKGLIARAFIQTDTFGDDLGRAGGSLYFAPVRVLVHCAIADATQR